MPDFQLERDIGGRVAGVDEAGRGPLAGPVVAAAVVLDGARIPPGLDDSKKLTAPERDRAFAALQATADIGVGIVEVAEIDRLNILAAALLAMAQAVGNLGRLPDFALVDGNRLPELPVPATALVKGDARSLSIAAASIIAKVTRDRIMQDLHRRFPDYGWAQNKGYGTRAHREAIERMGITPHHRLSFEPVKSILSEERLVRY